MPLDGVSSSHPDVPLIKLNFAGLEEFDNEKAAGGKTKLFQGLLGWNSVDDHVEARENKQFGDFIGPIRASVVPPVPDTRIAAMFHVKLHE